MSSFDSYQVQGVGSDQEAQVANLCLVDYGSSPWRTSSQRAADLYAAGAKLWRKEDFVDIEQQLAESYTQKQFTVRRFDGSIIHIINPMFGVLRPIWIPCVKFQEFWLLVASKPDGPPETYSCTYLIDWNNSTIRNYTRLFDDVRSRFEVKQQQWEASQTCKDFVTQFRRFLDSQEKTISISKIICFGLGDMNFGPPDWWKMQNQALPEDQREPDTSESVGALVHHAMALTIANIVRSYLASTGHQIQLFIQDPNYDDSTKEFLEDVGFTIVGRYGAEGFGLIDDESIVFSAFTKAPVKQIIADLARPLVIVHGPRNITGGVWNPRGKPWADPESPRTRQMWEDYTYYNLEVKSDDVQIGGSLHQLGMYYRINEDAKTTK